MSKAEERALEKYPYAEICREKYIEGYHQAEEDLELSWKDINTIIGLYNNLDDKTLCSPKRTCKEILKQFKEMKDGTTKR